jgi:acetyl-CoA carboxylase biotin carboxyl carrier protein
MELTEEEIGQILRLIDGSDFNELHLEMGDLKLTIMKGEHGASVQARDRSELNNQLNKVTVQADTETALEEEAQEEEAEAQGREAEDVAVGEEGLVPIKASMLGIFYRKPEPGAPPYVDIGSFVEEDTTVCLLEIMKVFNAVRAGVRGYIRKICAESGDVAEHGQTLFLVEPAENETKEEE